MGMYTELVMGFKLKKDTPKDVIDILFYMLDTSDATKKPDLPNHELFKTSRWDFLFNCSSYYFGFSDSHSIIKFDDISKTYIVNIRSSIENYDNKIELFVDWIRPYIESGSGANELIGYSLYEEDEEPKLYYLNESK